MENNSNLCRAKNFGVPSFGRIFFKRIDKKKINQDHCIGDMFIEIKKDILLEQININNAIMICWINLSFNIVRIKILNEVNGFCQTNSLNGIMGPSGAGKTTLLKCLSGRNIKGLSDDSKILVSKRRTKFCFIVQNVFEHLLERLTVRQTLLYASKLKNSGIIKDLDHKQIVMDLMSKLLISDTADTKVETCSGGEQKRIVIASELTSYSKPDILFIDEPTSGLDSNAAEEVIQCLKQICLTHQMTIITSIHQPNQDIFNMFDKIHVLAKKGICVYSGPPKELKTHLDICQIPCNQNQIPIEVLLKVSSEDTNTEQIIRLSKKSNETEKLLTNIFD